MSIFFYRCPQCHRERFYSDNIVMVICPSCQIALIKVNEEEEGDGE